MLILPTVLRRALVLSALAALAACSSTPTAPAAVYDFGLAPAAAGGPRCRPRCG